jgi:hypothetical protein
MLEIPGHTPAAPPTAPPPLAQAPTPPVPAPPVPEHHSPAQALSPPLHEDHSPSAVWNAVYDLKTSQGRQISGSASGSAVAVVARSPAIHRTWPLPTSACAPDSRDFGLQLYANLSTTLDMNGGDMAPSPSAAGSDRRLSTTMHLSTTGASRSRKRRQEAPAPAGSSATSKPRRQQEHAGSKQSAISKPRPADRPKFGKQIWQTIQKCQGWDEVQAALTTMARRDFPGGEWKSTKCHTGNRNVDYYFACPFAKSGLGCQVACRIRLCRQSNENCVGVPVPERPVVHKHHRALVETVHNQHHQQHSDSQPTKAHLMWKHACTAEAHLLCYDQYQITRWLYDHHIDFNKETVLRCKRFNERTRRAVALANVPAGISVNHMGAFHAIVQEYAFQTRSQLPTFDKHTVYILPGSFVQHPAAADLASHESEHSLQGPCLLFTTFNMSLNATRAAYWFREAGPVAQLDHTFKVTVSPPCAHSHLPVPAACPPSTLPSASPASPSCHVALRLPLYSTRPPPLA